MLYTILEPSLLISSEEAWMDLTTRDAFLLRLLDTLKSLEALPNVSLLWSDSLENQLWESPVAPPWRQDRDMRIRTVPVIHRYLQVLKEITDDHNELLPTTVDPNLNAPAGKEEMIDEAAKLISLCFETGAPWRGVFESGGGDVSFTYGGATQFLHVVRSERDWARCSHAIGACWPTNEEPNKSALSRLIKLTIDYEFAASLAADSQLDFQLTEQFLDSLIDHGGNAAQILWAIAKRLAFGQGRSGNDGGLQDESVASGQRRFRTNQACRIHYEYSNGAILFLRYYGSGEHDEGL